MAHDVHDAFFKAMFSQPEQAAGELVPRFRFLLDDLGLESDAALQHRAMSALGRLSLWCLRNARTPEQIVDGMGRWMDLVREVHRAPNGMAALVTIWRYVLLVGAPGARGPSGRRAAGARLWRIQFSSRWSSEVTP